MIYYPLSTLMLGGIRDILMITTPDDQNAFTRLLGDGSQWGLNIQYVVQPSPDGLAQAFILGRNFIGRDSSALILGDNIFHGNDLSNYLKRAAARTAGASVFIYQVSDPARFGVATLDDSGRVIALDEKPAAPKSNWAVTGLYFYDNEVVDIARDLKPSPRGELEITDLNRVYLESGNLHAEKLGRGYAWIDTGTPDALIEAGEFVRIIEKRQGLKLACIEEIAYLKGYIDAAQLQKLSTEMGGGDYAQYLKTLLH
jgi:glucose-1-phosphate thymidylyltransferase